MQKVFFSLLLIATVIYGCTETRDDSLSSEPITPEISQKEEVQDVLDEEVQTDVVDVVEQDTDSIKYAEGWKTFKTAVLLNDGKSLATMCNLDNVDIQSLVDAFDDPDYREMLEKGTMEDLVLDEYEAIPTYVFSASFTGDDGEGNIMESGLFLYFQKRESGLYLENFLAAG